MDSNNKEPAARELAAVAMRMSDGDVGKATGLLGGAQFVLMSTALGGNKEKLAEYFEECGAVTAATIREHKE